MIYTPFMPKVKHTIWNFLRKFWCLLALDGKLLYSLLGNFLFPFKTHKSASQRNLEEMGLRQSEFPSSAKTTAQAASTLFYLLCTQETVWVYSFRKYGKNDHHIRNIAVTRRPAAFSQILALQNSDSLSFLWANFSIPQSTFSRGAFSTGSSKGKPGIFHSTK